MRRGMRSEMSGCSRAWLSLRKPALPQAKNPLVKAQELLYCRVRGNLRMRKIGKYFLLIQMATLFLPLGYAQTEPRVDYAPKPPGSPSRVLLDNWNSIGRKLITMAED